MPALLKPSLFIGLLSLCLLFASKAEAAMVYCNHTNGAIEAAFGYREGEIWFSEGWWQIEPGQCARIYKEPLTQRFYFYFARSLAKPLAEGKKPVVWAGKYAFCIDNKAFRVEGDQNCEQRGYQRQGFQEIDLGVNARTYTLNFQ